MVSDHPKAFISYSWEDDEHKIWVKSLVDQLISDGIDAILDQYDLSLGDRLPQFMEQSISDADYVLIVCTPTYKSKSNLRKGGVGYRKTLVLCVDEANRKEMQYMLKQQQLKEGEAMRKNDHYSNINNIADEIKF